MGSVHEYSTVHGGRFLVRYKKPDGVHAGRRGFLSRADASSYLGFIESSIARGRYVDPMTARVTVGDLASGWVGFQTAVLRPSSARSLESAWRVHVAPTWGSRPLAEITHSGVRAWVAELAGSADRRMGSIHPYQTSNGKRYVARYRKPDNSQAGKRGFKTKREAELWLASVEVSKSQNDYVDPTDSHALIAELADVWLQDQAAVLKPSAMHPLESSWRIHVNPKWGWREVGSIRHSEVRAWVTEMTAVRGAVTVIRAYGILASVLDIAVRDRRIRENPARGVRLPKKKPKPRVYLSHMQVHELAEQSSHPEVVYFLAYTGLRWGEVTGLRLRHIDLARRRVQVQENAVLVNGTLHVGTPKSHVSRSVPYPDFLEPLVQACMNGKRRDHLLFGDGTNHMLLPNSRDGWFAAAVRRAQKRDPNFPKVSPHDLRHTAASLAISAGANVKAVQRMLGHASASMTLDTYADLFDDDLDLVANALGRARRAASLPGAPDDLVGAGSPGPDISPDDTTCDVVLERQSDTSGS